MGVYNTLLIEASRLGYKVDKLGNVTNNKGKKLKPFLPINGEYLQISIRMKSLYNYPKKVFVHRLQAYQKFGDSLFNVGIVVRHLDGNSKNNSFENILIGTNSDNSNDIPLDIRIKSATIASRKMQDDIRSYEERCQIYEDLKNGIPYKEIMLKHNVSSKGTLSFMKNKSIEYQEYLNKK